MLPKKGLTVAREASPIEGQNYGIASQPSQSRHPRSIVLSKLFRERISFFSFFIVYPFVFFNFLEFNSNYCSQ